MRRDMKGLDLSLGAHSTWLSTASLGHKLFDLGGLNSAVDHGAI